MAASVAVTSQNRAGNSLRCQLCDVTCTGNHYNMYFVFLNTRQKKCNLLFCFIQVPRFLLANIY